MGSPQSNLKTDKPGHETLKIEEVRYMVFGGGGAKGVAHIGVYERMCELYGGDIASELKGIAGISVGSIFALCIGIGIDIHAMRVFYKKSPFRNMWKYYHPRIVCGKWSIYNLDCLRKKLISIVKEKGYQETLTFSELERRRSVRLSVVVFNMGTKKREVLGFDTTPEGSVIDAVMASCAVPLYFYPQKAVSPNGTISCYSDGGIGTFMPLDIFPTAHTLFVHLSESSNDKLQIPISVRDRVISVDTSSLKSKNFHPTQEIMEKYWKRGGMRQIDISLIPEQEIS